MELTVVVVLMAFGIVAAWFFRKFSLPDVVGYVLGGMIASIILVNLGVDVKSGLSYLEPLRWFGLTLFYFTIGASIGFNKIVEKFHRILASELIIYAILWIATDLIALLLGVGYVERLMLFILFINSSTIAIATLVKRGFEVSTDLKDRVVVQTNTEDVFQLMLFTLLFVAGTSLIEGFFQALTHVIFIAGLVVVVTVVGKHILTLLSRTSFIADKETKFIVTVGTAILSASVISLAGLPPMFGAFIAGATFSLFLPLDDVVDMVNGLKNLGLLLYFTSIGSQMYLEVMGIADVGIIFLSLAIGLIAYLLRFIGLLIAFLFTEGSISNSLTLALSLSPLSEVGIAFVDTLAVRGVVGRSLVAVSTIAVLISITLFGATSPNLLSKVQALENLLPNKVVKFFEYVGRFYVKRFDVVVTMLRPAVKFASIALISTYFNSFILRVIEYFSIPMILAVVTSSVLATIIVVAFILTLRTMMNIFVSKSLPTAYRKLSTAFSLLSDIFLGGLAIALQIQLFFETIRTILIAEALLIYITLITSTISISVLIYELINYYRKLRSV